jgi:hypothetical protein
MKNSITSLNLGNSTLASPDLVSFVLQEFEGLKSLCRITVDDLHNVFQEYDFYGRRKLVLSIEDCGIVAGSYDGYWEKKTAVRDVGSSCE